MNAKNSNVGNTSKEIKTSANDDIEVEYEEEPVELIMQLLILKPFRDFVTPHLKELRQIIVSLIEDPQIIEIVTSDHLMQDQIIKIKLFALDLEALERLNGCGASLEDIVDWCSLDLWSLKSMSSKFVEAIGKYFIFQNNLLTESELKVHDCLLHNGFLQWSTSCCETFLAFCNDIDAKMKEFCSKLNTEKLRKVSRQTEKYKKFLAEQNVYKKMQLFAEMADDDY